MHARVSEDGLDEPGQAMDEMLNEESAQFMEQDGPTVTQDLDVNKEFEEGPTNAMNTVCLRMWRPSTTRRMATG